MTQTYGLALWWGWARGYAHIGAIQYLQENNIEIEEVAGASMWAFIGAMYASGISTQLMQHILSQVSYGKLFDGSIDTGAFGGKKLTLWLESIFGTSKIEDCSISLKIVSCDVQTGEKVVFDTWPIVDAVRASVAFPGLLSPLILDDKYLMDGGIVDNLPIDLIDNDHVIAISVVDNLYEKIENTQSFWWIKIPELTISKTQRILNNSVNIMIQRIEDLTIQSTDKKLILVRPEMQDYSMFDIEKLPEIVALGYTETKKVWEKK